MRLTTQNRLRKMLRKITAPQSGWLDVFPALMGRADGTVLTGTPGVVYVRNLLNGQVLAVYNATVPNLPNLQVEVGKRVDMPGLWQIKGMIEPYSTPSSGGTVGHHATQHQFPGGADIGWWDRKQILAFTVLVSDPENFIVRVYGGVFQSANGLTIVENQAIDLSSYVVTAGAKFVSIETDEDGVLSVNEGTAFEAPSVATVEDIPVPDSGQRLVAYVLMYEGQSALADADIRVPMPLGGGGSGGAVDWGDIGGNLEDQTDLKAELDAKADTSHTHSGLVTNGDNHDHSGGDGAQIAYSSLSGTPTILAFNDAEGDPADVGATASDGTSTYAARRDHVHAGSTGGSGAAPHALGGRLTLVSGTPTPSTDQLAKTAIYRTPYKGDLAPLYSGGNFTEENVPELTLNLSSNSGHTGYHQSGKNFDLWLYKDGSTWRLVSGPAWTNDTTLSQATQFIHGIEVNSADFTGRFGNGASDTLTVPQYMGVYIGSFRASANGQVEDSNAKRFLWNQYHPEPRVLSKGDTTDQWINNIYAWRKWNNSAANRIELLYGRAGRPIYVLFAGLVYHPSGNNLRLGIGLDSETTPVASAIRFPNTNGSSTSIYNDIPSVGYHYFQALEMGNGATSYFFGDNTGADLSGISGWILG